MRFFAFSMYFSFILQIIKNGEKNVESNCVTTYTNINQCDK